MNMFNTTRQILLFASSLVLLNACGGGATDGGGNAPGAHRYVPLNDSGVSNVVNYYDFGTSKPGSNASNLFIYNTPVSGLPPGQDGDFGRDKNKPDDTDGDKGFSFTKLRGNDGKTLPNDAVEWGCVRDNVTNLVWENKTKVGLHSYTSYFVWNDANAETNGGDAGESIQTTSCPKTKLAGDTQQFIQQVRAERLCGRTDWRLPTVEELRSIMDYGAELRDPNTDRVPLVDKRFFSHIHDGGHFWSSQTNYNDPKQAWAMDLTDGFTVAHSKACKTTTTSAGDVVANFYNSAILVSGDFTY